MNRYGKIFNIRVPPSKQQIIEEYKRLVIEDLHSDLCFVTTMLIESYVKAMREIPEPTQIKLVKQDITIQQFCTNIYGTSLKRARRLAPQEMLIPKALPKCEVCGKPATRRYIYPRHGYFDVCNEHSSLATQSLGYKDLTKLKQEFDIAPTFPMKPKRKKKVKKKRKLWSRVKQLLTKVWRR